ncbi:hypothetical protein V1509DRAFT_620129 [Lipomyces kononenkoae]
MSDAELLKTKKDALVAALTQLSNAAQDASRACIDFYAAASIPGAPPLFSIPPAAAALLPAAQISSSADAATPAVNGSKKLGAAAAGDKKTVGAEISSPQPEPDEDEGEVAVSGGKKHKRKRIVDPDAPRRPQTVYFAFANEARKLIREEYQAKGIEASNTEIIREVAERWKNMSDEQKEPWKAIYAEQIKRYDEEKAAYNAGKGKEKEKVREEEKVNISELPEKKRGRKKKIIAAAPEEAEVETTLAAPHEPEQPSTPAIALPTPAPTQPEPTEATPVESPSKVVKRRKHRHEGGAAAGIEGGAAATTPMQPAAEPGAPTPKEKRKRKKKSEAGPAPPSVDEA